VVVAYLFFLLRKRSCYSGKKEEAHAQAEAARMTKFKSRHNSVTPAKKRAMIKRPMRRASFRMRAPNNRTSRLAGGASREW
jgi:hypothetical protein